MTTYTVRELAELVAGDVEGDAAKRVTGVAPVDRAGPNDVTYVVNERYAKRFEPAGVAACLVPPGISMEADGAALIRVDNPELALATLLDVFHPSPEPEPSVHPTAIIARGARIGGQVSIAPFVTIEDGVRLGRGTQIGPHTHIGSGTEIGEDCRIGPSCTVLHGVRIGDRVRLYTGVRLGVEGFGYTPGPRGLHRIPQVGGCIIGDDVDIGANCTVDRGSLGDTVIGEGTKIDNLVHIAHNVRVGKHCVIVAQVGVAGSVEIGDGAQLGGQAGISGHLTIGAGARLAAQAGVFGDIPAGAVYSGYPARPHRQSLRASALTLKLPELLQRIRRLERACGASGE